MRQIHHAADAENQRQAQGEQEVIASQDQAVDDLLQQENDLHGSATGDRRLRAGLAAMPASTVSRRGYILQVFSALVVASKSSG